MFSSISAIWIEILKNCMLSVCNGNVEIGHGTDCAEVLQKISEAAPWGHSDLSLLCHLCIFVASNAMLKQGQRQSFPSSPWKAFMPFQGLITAFKCWTVCLEKLQKLSECSSPKSTLSGKGFREDIQKIQQGVWRTCMNHIFSWHYTADAIIHSSMSRYKIILKSIQGHHPRHLLHVWSMLWAALW